MAKKRVPHSVDNAEIEKNALGTPQYMFASTLNRLMEEQGIDQEKMAADLGLSTGIISNYRHGKTEPKLSSILNIANYLNVDCHYLLTGIKAKNSNFSKKTGLSDKAIENISKLKDHTLLNGGPSSIHDGSIEILNRLLSMPQFYICLRQISIMVESWRKHLATQLFEHEYSARIRELEEELDDESKGRRISTDICEYSMVAGVTAQNTFAKLLEVLKKQETNKANGIHE